MRQNRLSVKIKKPANEVFDFTINPANTHLWIESIKVENADEWPPGVGTVYHRQNDSGKWSAYTVQRIVKNKIFELVMEGGNYHVCYRYFQRGNGITLMEYFEWVEKGELEDPFTQSTLEKLKSVMENS